MHDHETCEQLMTAAGRSNNTGRLEYLAKRCDMQHGDLTTNPTRAADRAARETKTDPSAMEASNV